MAASLSCAGPTAGRFLAREAEPDEAYVEGMEPAPPLGLLPVMDLLVGLAAEAVGSRGWGRGVTISRTIRAIVGRSSGPIRARALTSDVGARADGVVQRVPSVERHAVLGRGPERR